MRQRLGFAAPNTGVRVVLALGAHCDDIEIGCGGSILKLAMQEPVFVHWVVFSSDTQRAIEARNSADMFLAQAAESVVDIHEFRNGYFPTQLDKIKDCFEELKKRVQPDLVFTHYRLDRHQDHRVVSDLTWNTFRDHLILEYEIMKYDGDIGNPNVFIELEQAILMRKIEHIEDAFVSQRDKQWFDAETFRALTRLRGVECNAASRYAEAFYGRKLSLFEA